MGTGAESLAKLRFMLLLGRLGMRHQHGHEKYRCERHRDDEREARAEKKRKKAEEAAEKKKKRSEEAAEKKRKEPRKRRVDYSLSSTSTVSHKHR